VKLITNYLADPHWPGKYLREFGSFVEKKIT
jgi:hypothetical protein